jgi:hypothetical protein
MTDDREQKTDDREQRAENRKQRTARVLDPPVFTICLLASGL